MEHIVKSVTVDAAPSRVYQLLSQPDNLPRILPGDVEVTNVERINTRGWRYHWNRRFLGVHFDGEASTAADASAHRIAVKISGGLVGTRLWTLKPANGGTQVTVTCDIHLPMPLLHKHSLTEVRGALEKDVEAMLANLSALVGETAPRDERQTT